MLAVALGTSRSGSLVQHAPATAARLKNPVQGDRESERAGEKLYARECASCHGSSLEGRGAAPPLNQPEVYRAAPGALFWVLRNGSLRRDAFLRSPAGNGTLANHRVFAA